MSPFKPLLLILLPALVLAEEGPAQKDIDAAIKKGVAYLNETDNHGNAMELVTLALLHGGIPATDPMIRSSLESIVEEQQLPTYNTALGIMVLHLVDPEKHQKAIAWKAALLVQNQCANGQWTYALSQPPKDEYPVDGEREYQVYAGEQLRPATRRFKGVRIPPRSCPSPLKNGDNSNTLFALLGLRAAAESGCRIPDQVWTLTRNYLKRAMKPNGGLSYDCDNGNPNSHKPTGTMGTAGIAMASICDTYLRISLKDDPLLQGMIRWLDGSFAPDRSTWLKPDDPPAAHYYYLYGVERAAAFAGRAEFNGQDWYRAGAAWLLKMQARDGSWHNSGKDRSFPPAVDTAFAILFLRRATMPLGYEVGDGTPVPPRG